MAKKRTKKDLAPCVAVLNMKGGVGKTTVSAHVMRMVYQTAQVSTLLVDLDPQFNLSQALIPHTAYEQREAKNQTVFAAMEGPTATGIFDAIDPSPEPPPVADLALRLHSVRLADGDRFIDIVPGDFRLVKYSLMDEREKLAKVQARFLRFIEAAREQYGLVCIDCNPSSSFITLCALHACNFLLVPVRDDKYSILGLQLLTTYLERIDSLDERPETLVLVNRTNASSGVVSALRTHSTFGPQTLVAELRHSGYLAAKANYTGFATDRTGPYSGRIRTEITLLAQELGKKLGL